MIAHIRKSDGSGQTAAEHCDNVSRLANNNAFSTGLESAAKTAGALHDLGKFCKAFELYITGKGKPVFHSPTGAIYAYEKWYSSSSPDSDSSVTAQIISMVIRAHHGGLLDCVSPVDLTSPFLSCLKQDKGSLSYDETILNFHELFLSEADENEHFRKACDEIAKIIKSSDDTEYNKAMTARCILSCVVDADRWDSACFEAEKDPFAETEKPDWSELSSRLEKYLSTFSIDSEISKLRSQISQKCLDAAASPRDIYTLTVPTGGGKTLSSLRFALNHAQEVNATRIFYVIPYNTILEQNGADIRTALNDYEGILEHYGTFTASGDEKEIKQAEDKHDILTERWDMPIILTSMVQFLNSAYKGSNTDARRFCRLAGSVIIFDEIQALPKKCTVLFEKLVLFLKNALNCTVLLCTATQPGLHLSAKPLLSQDYTQMLGEKLKRTQLTDLSSTPLTYENASNRLIECIEKYGSVLAVTNTRAAAKELYELTSSRLGNEPLKIHLSTSMCPQHRLDSIVKMKTALSNGSLVFCVSTMLIEAGVNISFPCVVRSLAGLPNIMQVAGRCNRHMELGVSVGNVEIWYLMQENLKNLSEIYNAANCTRGIIAGFPGALDTEEAMEKYFSNERNFYTMGKNLSYLKYKYQQKPDYNLTDMLGRNSCLANRCRQLQKQRGALNMYQSFASVGKQFEVIESDTVNVITPYRDGEKIIVLLNGDIDLEKRIRLLRQAEKYSVGIYRNQLLQMIDEGEIYHIGETGVYALASEYYDLSLGHVKNPGASEFLNM